MNFKVSSDAANWFINELDLEQGDYVQFFVKLYGGIPTAHPNYYLGISVGKDGDTNIKDELEGITFYFNSQDSWFLDEYDLKIEMGNEEVEYIFSEKR
jgi:uncharacterized protein YneR